MSFRVVAVPGRGASDTPSRLAAISVDKFMDKLGVIF